jgi:transcriptional regulator with XRE-family HTH domain
MAFNLNRLKAERIAKGYTQAQFANKLQMSREAYAKRESGRVNISVEEFSHILRALGYDTKSMSIFFCS